MLEPVQEDLLGIMDVVVLSKDHAYPKSKYKAVAYNVEDSQRLFGLEQKKDAKDRRGHMTRHEYENELSLLDFYYDLDNDHSHANQTTEDFQNGRFLEIRFELALIHISGMTY